jgi:hypothetical protein
MSFVLHSPQRKSRGNEKKVAKCALTVVAAYATLHPVKSVGPRSPQAKEAIMIRLAVMAGVARRSIGRRDAGRKDQ